MNDLNPYTAPSDLETTSPADSSGHYGQMDGFLAVRNGAELPHVCVVSGQATDEREWRKKVTLSWTPLWVRFAPALIILAISMATAASIRTNLQNPLERFMRPMMFPMLFAGVSLIQFLFWKRAKVTYSLDPDVRTRFIRNRIGGVVSLGLAAGMFVAGIEVKGRWFTSAAALVLFVAGIILTTKSTPLRVTRFRDGWFLLKGASANFISQLPPV